MQPHITRMMSLGKNTLWNRLYPVAKITSPEQESHRSKELITTMKDLSFETKNRISELLRYHLYV